MLFGGGGVEVDFVCALFENYLGFVVCDSVRKVFIEVLGKEFK